MPQFTKPTLTNKRKYDESNDTTTSSYKRQSTGQGSTHVSHDSTHNQSRDRFWYVQWYAIASVSQDYLYLITLGVIPNKRNTRRGMETLCLWLAGRNAHCTTLIIGSESSRWP